MNTTTKKLTDASLLILREGVHCLTGEVSTCRFDPCCSVYAREAFKEHGIFKGTFLFLGRLYRCRPGGSFGYDPVPPRLGVSSGL